MEGLHARWQDVAAFVPDHTKNKWWDRLVSAYSPRKFRGFSHLETMFQHYDIHKDCLRDRYAVAVAIFFKNIVYDPQASDNAEKSVECIREFAKETTFDQENYVADLIMQSGSGTTDAHLTQGATGSDDTHYLIDFEMAYMASSACEFASHEAGIRAENPQLGDLEYNKQRVKLLQFFLQVPNIFATKEMREVNEKAARENITKEIARLSA